MDRPVSLRPWSPARWALPVRLIAVAVALAAAALLVVRLIAGAGEKILRIPMDQVTSATVTLSTFHDVIPLRASVVPRETVYVDAIDGGQVERVLVEAGDSVQQGQPIIELNNTNLALQVIQQESQLNQAISQLQQNEIALEQNQLSNDRALVEIDYNLVRLGRSVERRSGLASKGLVSNEERDAATDELAYYRRLRPIQAESGQRQSSLRDRLLPDIHRQLGILRGNLTVVHDKLAGLVIRAPVAGRITALDLKVGETRAAGQRLAEVTPEVGMKLIADIDEFYLTRVHAGQKAVVTLNDLPARVAVTKVSPQVQNGQIRIDLDFESGTPAALVEGASAQGRLQLGGDSQVTVLATGAFLERSGGNWVFVLAPDGKSAVRRDISSGRRTAEQLEILRGLAPGERVITSDYTGLEKVDRVILTQ
ncbi:MAG TPA: HlyD family efflux transporter periplasmic adaptor subunit [Steroidobacteraceae bacterium]|jgi:HlyD family secretion protein